MRWLAAALLFRFATAQSAPDVDRAKALFEQGVGLMDSGRFEEAIAKFRSAYALYPNPKILLNLGGSLVNVGRNVEAVDAYQRFLRTGNPERDLRAEVEAVLRRIYARIGRLRIEVNEPGALVLVDGIGVGPSPLVDPLPIVAGAHRIEATKEGFRSATVALPPLGAGEERTVTLDLEPTSGRKASPPPTPTPTPAPKRTMGSQKRASFAMLAGGEVAIQPQGAGLLLGVAYAPVRYVEASAAAVLSRDNAARVALALVPWPDWMLTPALVAGAPFFFVFGDVQPGVHAGLLLRLGLSRWLAVEMEGSVEHFPSMPENVEPTFLLVGARVRAYLM